VITCRDLLFLPLSRFLFCILPLLLFVHLSVLITRLSSQSQVLFLPFYQSTLHGPLFYPQLACPYLFRHFKINPLKSFFFRIDFFSFSLSSFMSKTCIHFSSFLPSQSIIISVMCLRFPMFLVTYLAIYIYS